MMMSKALLKTSAMVLLLSGCSLAPDDLRPSLPVVDLWPVPQQTPAQQPSLAQVPWQDFFTNPDLQVLIQTALDNNRDLRVALLNVQMAQATYRVSEAALLPSVGGNVDDTIQRTPKQLALVIPQTATTTHTYNVNLGVTAYELDLWGHVHSLEKQALEQFLASQEGQSAARIALIAEVANASFTVLADRKLLHLAQDTLISRTKSLDLIQRSFTLGVGSQLDVTQARQAVETARVARTVAIRRVEQDKNALTLLLGTAIDEDRLNALGDLDAQHVVADLPIGLPSEVLLKRPDIVQAEHLLMAANANIGVARAAFFPTISLTGSAGFSSLNLTSLFQGSSAAWAFAPQITMPIFDEGKNNATLDSAKAAQQIALAQYEKSIQSAFREVSDALVAKATLSDQMSAQTALVQAASDSTRLSQARFDKGVDSYLTVLDSERTLFSAQQDLISVRASNLTNLVTLYKALGGGQLGR